MVGSALVAGPAPIFGVKRNLAVDRGWRNESEMSPTCRKTARLRWGRISVPGAIYFLTTCTQHRVPVFAQPEHANRLVGSLERMNTTGDIELLAATIMPDHAHLVIGLGSRLSVGQVMAKFKTLARDSGRVPWRWQQDGFELRLRAKESAENYGFYVFMNPYSAGLVTTARRWPWWVCPHACRFAFMQYLGPDGTPPEEWLEDVEKVGRRIETGA
jgi:putative transposase